MDLAGKGGYGAESGAGEGRTENCAGHGHGWLGNILIFIRGQRARRMREGERIIHCVLAALPVKHDAVTFRLSPMRAGNALISETRVRRDIRFPSPFVNNRANFHVIANVHSIDFCERVHIIFLRLE